MHEPIAEITYAHALFQVAHETGKAEQILEEITWIENLFRENRKYYLLLLNPGIGKLTRKELIHEAFAGKINRDLLNFLLLLLDKRRLRSFEGIAYQYRKAVAQSKNLIEGTVISATPLPAEQIEEIQKKVSRLMRKEITLHNQIDPGIIGGIKIFAEDKIIDASVTTRLKIMRDSLKTNMV